jgi:hypothetical protein
MVVSQTCGTRTCVNLAHLVARTQLETVFERDKAGRVAHGERAGRAKLTEATAREILLETQIGRLTHRQVSARFGVSIHTVKDIAWGRTWTHLRNS